MSPAGTITDFDGFPTMSGLPGADTVREYEAPGRLEGHCPVHGNVKTDDTCFEVEPWQPHTLPMGRCVPRTARRGRGGELATQAELADPPTTNSFTAAEPARPSHTFEATGPRLGDGDRYGAGPALESERGAAVGVYPVPDVRAGVLPEEISGTESPTPGGVGERVVESRDVPHEAEPPPSSSPKPFGVGEIDHTTGIPAIANSRSPMANSNSPIADLQGPRSEQQLLRAAGRLPLAESAAELRGQGMSWEAVARELGASRTTVWRLGSAYARRGFDGCVDGWDRSGAKGQLPDMEPEQKARLQQIYLRTNRTRDAGSMRTAAKFWAMDQETPELWRHAVLSRIEKGQLPGPVKRALREVTQAHVEQYRRPRLAPVVTMAGTVGANVRDKIDRRRVIESDDGTLNFVACIPWPMGGDPCSDKHGVRIGRWQWLPMIECGWSHQVVGYSLVCRPKGSYRAEDIRTLIHQLALARGLPDEFRFEHGAWESDSIVGLIQKLGVTLTTVNQPNQKPFVEGFFGKAWTYLSVMGGQVGRFRGDMETENRIVEACRAGRRDPRVVFPMLADAVRALDGTVATHNSDTVDSIYGRWVPNARAAALDQERPWRQLPPALRYLFSPICREWTVAAGSVGGNVPILEDLSVPFHFAHSELWRWNGHKVRLYFDHTADDCRATIVSVDGYAGVAPGQVIFEAELIEQIPHQARAACGWVGGEAKVPQWRKAAMAALRRETRMFDTRGQVMAARSEARDGRGRGAIANSQSPIAKSQEAVDEGHKGATKSRPTKATKPTVDFRELAAGSGRMDQGGGYRVSIEALREL